MWEEIYEYQKYLLNFRVVNKPIMPNFNVFEYTDNEYVTAISFLKDFEMIDEERLTIDYLKGE